MDDVKTKPETSEGERLLAEFSARDRRLVEDVISAHPGLTVEEAIEALTLAGGL
jgi:hypothetical protein